MSIRWVEKLEARIEEPTPLTLEQRVTKLETMLADTMEWISEMGEDLISRTARKEGQIDS
jgi:hypothetical protein